MQTRLGLIAFVLLVATAVLAWGPWENETLQGALLRSGLICGATWLAWDDLCRLNPWISGIVVVGIVILARWPRLFPIAFLVWVVLYFLRPRQPTAR